MKQVAAVRGLGVASDVVGDGMKESQEQTLQAFASTTAVVTENFASCLAVRSEPTQITEDS